MITGERMAAVDANAAALGVSRKQLMESSGHAVARAVRDVAEPGARVVVVAGRGNNGGDAFVAARFLDGPERRSGSDRDASRSGREYDVTTLLLGRAALIGTDIARENWDALQRSDYETREVTDSSEFESDATASDLDEADVIVDAMLGTGISGDLREPAASAAATINEADATVVAVDVPSGFDADRGDHADNAVAADCVVTFHDAKPGWTTSRPRSASRISAFRPRRNGSSAPGTSISHGPTVARADRTLSAAVPTPARRRSRHRPRFGPAPNSPSSLRPSPSPARFRGIARISSSNRTRATFSRPSGPRTSSRRPNSTTTWSCWARARHRRRDPRGGPAVPRVVHRSRRRRRGRARGRPRPRDRRHVGLYAQQTGTRKNGWTGRRRPGRRGRRDRSVRGRVGSRRARQRGDGRHHRRRANAAQPLGNRRDESRRHRRHARRNRRGAAGTRRAARRRRSGAHVNGLAGERLAETQAFGFLASELLEEIPAALWGGADE